MNKHLVVALACSCLLLPAWGIAQTSTSRPKTKTPVRREFPKSVRNLPTSPRTTPKTVRLTAQQLRLLVEDLSAPKFIERESAMLGLVAAGEQGVKAIAEMLDKNRPEGLLRGIHVLKHIGLRGDLASQEAARLALVGLTESKDGKLSRRAMSALATVNSQRQEEAVKALTALGASIEVRTSRFNMQFVRMFTVRIDDNWRGTDKDLVRLEWLTDCEQVEFRGKAVKDEWFKHLRFMPRLRALSVRDAKVSDSAFKACRKAKTINYIDIRYSPIGDATAAVIREMSKLTSVTLYGTKVTQLAAMEIKKRHPTADVDFRRGAFLGIGCPSPPNPCVVTTLRPGTAAHKAGIQEQDIIVKFDKRKINDFDDLRTMIGSKTVGDSATIVVIRPNGRRVGTALRLKDQKLGIVTEKHPLGLRIKSVEKGSAAADMQLQPNDVIRVFMGEGIIDFKSLAAAYGKVGAGRQLTMTFSRDHKELTKKVVFGRWDNDD